MTDQRHSPRAIIGDEDHDGRVLTTVGGVPQWLPSSVPVLLLPAGSTAADVPAGTPVPAIVLVKGA